MPLFGQSSPKKATKGVSFKDTIIDGVSQPVTEDEDDALYWFDRHSDECDACYRPLKVYRRGGHFCAEGLSKARRVAKLSLELRHDVVLRHDTQTQQYIRVEVPTRYKNTFQLLQVLQHTGVSSFEQPMDRTYDVRPRIDSQRHEVKPSSAPVDNHSNLIEFTPSSRKTRRRKPRYSSGRGSRGSLFDDDVMEQDKYERRESKLQYDLAPETILPHWYHQSYYPQCYSNYNYLNPYSYGTT